MGKSKKQEISRHREMTLHLFHTMYQKLDLSHQPATLDTCKIMAINAIAVSSMILGDEKEVENG